MSTARRFVPVSVTLLACAAFLFGALQGVTLAWPVDNKEDAEKRVGHDIKYLASDELEGRGPGTKGLDVAAEYIVDEFKKAGLASGTEDGSYKQPFEIAMGRDLVADEAALVFHGPNQNEIKLVVGEQFQPQQVGGNVNLENADLVFVGYGITAEEHNYDEYKDVDVEGKVVVVVRREPQQENENSVFDGAEHSNYALINSKIAAAQQKKAAAIILVNDRVTAPDAERDELLPPDGFGRRELGVPFIHAKREAIDKILADAPIVLPDGSKLSNLKDVEQRLDETLEPVSQPIHGWTADLGARFADQTVTTYNVVGMIEGEGPHADETVVIGAHYDHLGLGGFGSRAPNRRGEIHNGADDNATGTAGIMELARRFGQAAKDGKKPPRRLVFIAFSGEERGLLGSSFYVDNPLFSLENTIAMINFDMIGWLRDGKVTVYGTGSCAEFDGLVDKVFAEGDVQANKIANSFAGSDHMPFFRSQVPVLFLHTGLTDTYHTPDDDYETINVEGAVQVIDYTEKLIHAVSGMEAKPAFVGSARSDRRRPAYLGARFDFEAGGEGLPVDNVTEDSPAAKAGLQQGDVVLSVDGKKLTDRNELNDLLREKQPGDKIEIKFTREGEEKSIEVELEQFRRRGDGGIS